MSELKRVKYNNCPLAEVVYQFNFPTILSIETDAPAEFQNVIRTKFPHYQQHIEKESHLMVSISNRNINPMFKPNPDKKIHLFISDDGTWKVTLAKNYISISTLKYEQWEDLKIRFCDVLQTFINIYKPIYFERIGLRYIDVFNLDVLQLTGTPWSELIEPHLLGCLSLSSSENLRVGTSSVKSELFINDIAIRIEAGLAMANKGEKESFILDCDYYKKGKVNIQDIKNVSEQLHDESASFFQKSITSKLHEAMKPEIIK